MHVVKIGGAAGIGLEAFCADVAALTKRGARLVIVHGGSDETNRLSEELGHPPRFVTSPSGHTSRLTDERTLEIFMMATGVVNRRLVAGLHQVGVNAVGLSGLDGALIRARRKEAIRIVENGRQRIIRNDRTGRPESVNTDLIRTLFDGGYVPVVAPLGLSESHEPLNIDGDRGAAALAGALGAAGLVILSNVPGVLRDVDDEGSVVRRSSVSTLKELEAVARGRMLKKILAAAEALSAGVPEVIISDARRDKPLSRAFAGEGTVIIGDSSLERSHEAT